VEDFPVEVNTIPSYCPNCLSSNYQLYHHDSNFYFKRCSQCSTEYVTRKNLERKKKMLYVIVTDENDRKFFESERQAQTVAEKLAAQNGKTYYTAQVILKSELAVTPVKTVRVD
jgi:hypothetical protein